MPKKPAKVFNVEKEESDAAGQPKPLKPTDDNSKSPVPNQEKSAKVGDCDNKLKKTKPRKADEIDEIFANLKKRKAEQAKPGKSGDAKDKTKKMRSKVPREGLAFNNDAKPKRRTNDGFVVYTEEELGINKKDSGGTALCPFDCSCCF